MKVSASNSTVGLILASGVGSRMGGPKALLRWEGAIPLAVAHVNARRADCREVHVVTRVEIGHVLHRLAPSLPVIRSTAPDELGPAGSIWAAARAGAMDRHAWVLIVPVDTIPPDTSTVRSLQRKAIGNVDVVCPVHDGRGGHPVLCRSALLRERYERDAPILRDVLQDPTIQRVDEPVHDPKVLVDFDTPEALLALTGRTAGFLAWPV